MKPRVFIGSSTESLNVAYAIQENLDYDGLMTVWNQGIFQLSSNTIDDLIQTLQNSDFAIFVFQPDDMAKMRNQNFPIVRDNVIFELGLFIGRLGKERVFFLIPNSSAGMHLPTDLIGITPGKYNDERKDNLNAALGPFCNKVRQQLIKFTAASSIDLTNESERAKELALEKPHAWDLLLVAELIKTRLITINKNYDELEKGLIFHKTKTVTDLNRFKEWMLALLEDYIKLARLYEQILARELVTALGPSGVSANIKDLKKIADSVLRLFEDMLSWEYELHSIKPPEKYIEVINLMKGWTKSFIFEINKVPEKIIDACESDKPTFSSPVQLNFSIGETLGVDEIISLLESINKGA